jgi:hypothetical protein
MFGELLGQLVDKEKAASEAIQDTLQDISEELGCDGRGFFVIIQAADETFKPDFFIMKMVNGVPQKVRKLELKEVFN